MKKCQIGYIVIAVFALNHATKINAEVLGDAGVEEMIVYGYSWDGWTNVELGRLFSILDNSKSSALGITPDGTIYNADTTSQTSNNEDKPDCAKSMANGGFTSVVMKPVEVSVGFQRQFKGNLVRAAWENIAVRAQAEYGGKLAYDAIIGVHFVIPYEVLGATHYFNGPIIIYKNKSVYESILDHVNFDPLDSRARKYDCKAP